MDRNRVTGSGIGSRLNTQRATRNPKATHQTCRGFICVTGPLAVNGAFQNGTAGYTEGQWPEGTTWRLHR